MLKKVITSTNYMTGEKEEESYYFNFTQSELMEMHMTTPGGMDAKLDRMINTKDSIELTNLIKSFIIDSYGERSDDGKYFMKKDENGRSLGEKFAQTDAYNVLFMELFTDANKCAAFINGIIPKEVMQEINVDPNNTAELQKQVDEIREKKDAANPNLTVLKG